VDPVREGQLGARRLEQGQLQAGTDFRRKKWRNKFNFNAII
jgi:hypothetical protein